MENPGCNKLLIRDGNGDAGRGAPALLLLFSCSNSSSSASTISKEERKGEGVTELRMEGTGGSLLKGKEREGAVSCGMDDEDPGKVRFFQTVLE